MKSARIVARFTDRLHGSSAAPYTSCNLGLHVGDDPLHVVQNRERVAASLGVSLDSWVAGDQVHGDTVTVVTEEMRGRGARAQADLLPATDALITNVPGITLSTYAADCVPLLFADDAQEAIGVAHAGWKGTVAKIAAKTVRQMATEFGTDPDTVRVLVGPAIGPCCYEVDERVADRVRAAFADRHQELLTPNENGRWQLDLWQANICALQEAGVPLENIHRENKCTSCDVDTYFSHRKENGQTGRHAGIIALLSK
ncbi:MAG: peptidoglycan editing factor PgeF [Tumebacillaceae bacterium]